MNIIKNDTFTELKFENISIEDIAIKVGNCISEFQNENLIINLSGNINIKIEDFSLFLKLSNIKKEHGTSFVLICKGIEIDDIPEEINVVPSLEEAIDVIQMEAIERDLGF
jgi:hypothetical protein